MTDMGREKLLQELAYLDQAEYINKQAYTQLVKMVEEHFEESTVRVCKDLFAHLVRFAIKEGGYPMPKKPDTVQTERPGEVKEERDD